MTWLIIIGILAGLILSHELGHFIAAKLAKVKVLEFGLGYPPRLFSVRFRDTIYSFNTLPFGGFVRLLGEDDPRVPGGLASKKLLPRLFVIGSGPLVNAVLPILLFAISFMIPRSIEMGVVRVVEVLPQSPAAAAGLLPGDGIVAVNGHKINNPWDLIYEIRLNLGSTVTLEVLRQGRRLFLEAEPRFTQPPLGIKMALEDRRVVKVAYSPGEALVRSLITIRDMGKLFWNEILSWFKGGAAPEVGGPIAIAQLTGEVVKLGPSPLLALIALISFNLALINLIPFPALDGSRMLFAVIEKLKGRPLSPVWQKRIHMMGFIFLLTLIFIISYFDILRIMRGESLLP